MVGDLPTKASPGDDDIAGGEAFAVAESWDQPVRPCPMWPPELALPQESAPARVAPPAVKT